MEKKRQVGDGKTWPGRTLMRGGEAGECWTKSGPEGRVFGEQPGGWRG